MNKNRLKRVYRNIKKTYFPARKRYQPNQKYGSKRLELVTHIATFSFILLLLGTLLIIIILGFISRELPNPNSLLERSYELSTKVSDRNDKPIFEVFGEKNRTLVILDDVSIHVMDATMAVEDADFYMHKGFSLRGMARAVKNMILGQSVQSGSTLTQQVIKNTLLTQEQTVIRKIKELILSLQLENAYSKDDILQMYINESPYGGQNYGIFTAAETYFNKNPKDLNLSESAYLAGLPQRPSYYSQFGTNPESGIERRNYVLWLMKDRGWLGKDGNRYFISEEEYQEAKNFELQFETAAIPFKAPHFIFYMKQVLINMFGEDVVEQGGLQVKTTLDLDLQKETQKLVYEEIEKVLNLNVNNGGIVVLDPKTGQILAMVGSKGYFLPSEPEGCISGTTGANSCLFEPQLNVVLAKRQPGSAIKPITYATMLQKGYTAAYPFLDVPTKFPGAKVDEPYEPENYDGIFRGPMSLRKSLGGSINISAVKSLGIVGIDDMIELAEAMGISTFTDRSRFGLALALGGGETKLLELTGAFGIFANEGKFYPPTPILEVKDSQGNILYKWQDTDGKQVLDKEVAFLISDILSDDGARSEVFGFGSLLNIPGYQVAVKTGTTDDKRDNYAIGFTPSIVVGVWVGNNNNDKMNPYIASGITGATPIWNRFMTAYLADNFASDPEEFKAPENVHKVKVDQLTGVLPYKDYSTRMEWFIDGTEPNSVSNWYQRLEICKEDGRLANNSCRENGDTDEKTFIGMQAERPEWQSYVDKWVGENYGNKDEYFPPKTQTCLEFESDGDVKDNGKICVNILYYKDDERVPLDFRLGVEVSSAKDIEEVKIYMDNEKVTTDKSEPWGYNFELNPSQLGTHTFKVVAEDEKGNVGEKNIKLEVTGYVLD